MSKVSVLVAVYNSAGCLGRCMESLLAQTLTDIQIICVDDGSTDNSVELLNAYATMDPRVEVIVTGRNMGQAHARNIGLEQANGEYITFVDSDDWISKDALEKGVETFESDKDIDCVLFHVEKYYPETKTKKPYPMEFFSKMDGKKAFEASLTWKIHGWYMVTAKIHRKHPYDESCKAYSDDNTTRTHYLASRKVGCCHGTYYYYQNPESVTHAVSMRRFDHMRANESMKKQLTEIGANQDIIRKYENVRWLVLVDTYMFYFRNRQRLTRLNRQKGMAEMRRIWKGIDTGKLEHRLKAKFGYRPLRFSWTLFRIQEEIYFALKTLLGR